MRLLKLLLLLILLVPNAAGAATYWEDTFEDGILNDTWDISACEGTPPADGCNAKISSDFAYNGTKSLKSTYHPTCTLCQQGTYYDRTFPATEEVWTRSYVRTTNFTYEASAGSKYYYIRSLDFPAPNFFLINWFGSRQMGFGSQVEASLCPNGDGPYDSCVYYPNVASVSLNDNQWYCIEAHVKMNTPGQPDGMAELYVDGTKTLGYYNRTFRGPNATNGPNNDNYGAATLNVVRHYTQVGAGDRYTDDLAVGDTRIGCGGAPPPPTDTTPPSPPSGSRGCICGAPR